MDLHDRIDACLDSREYDKKEYVWAKPSPCTDEDFKTVEIPMEFPYELDTFQKQAASHIAKHENVIVTSHTGAGKSTVITLAVLDGLKSGKVFVTNPIKALSSQGYRKLKKMLDKNEKVRDLIEYVDEEEDYYDYYDDEDQYYSSSFTPDTQDTSDKDSIVGILTGDDQINETAPVVVMTTEILHSMLMRNVNLNELQWVVIDEAHTIDSERGHVIENVIAMLPPHVGIILLSATIPNAIDVAEWVGRNRQQPVYLTGTDKRPVPLNFYLHIGERTWDDKPLFKLKEGAGAFDHDQWHRCLGKVRANSKAKTTKTIKHRWQDFIKELEEEELLPAIIFDFSKKRLEQFARCLQTVDYIPKRLKSRIHGFYCKALRKIEPDDRTLGQIIFCKELALRGLGMHHGGMIPMLKEVTQVLFEKGYIKVLFATETLAMGIDAPCRTTVFASLRKSDGKEFRQLNRSEFIQISGRAGRRGRDVRGHVVVTMWNHDDIANLPAILEAKAENLQSHFELKDQVILSILRRGDSDVSIEDLMRSSFMETDTTTTIRLLKDVKREYLRLEDASDLKLERLIKINRMASISAGNVAEMCFPELMKFVKPGRMIVLSPKLGTLKLQRLTVASRMDTGGYFKVKEIPDEIRIDWVYKVEGFKPKKASMETHDEMESLRENVDILLKETEELEIKSEVMDVARKRCYYEHSVGKMRDLLSADHLNCMPLYKEKYKRLTELDYIKDDMITWKGRCACEINACDSVVLVEYLLDSKAPVGNPAKLAAVLSALVYDRKTDEDDDNACAEFEDLMSIHKKVRPHEIDDVPRPGMIKCIERWASGSSFKEACSYTSEQPGSVVRVLSRLHEVLRELSEVGDHIGNPDIIDAANEANEAIFRGLPFMTSLSK